MALGIEVMRVHRLSDSWNEFRKPYRIYQRRAHNSNYLLNNGSF